MLHAPAGGLLLLDGVSGDVGIQGGAYRVGLAGSRPQDVCQLLTGGGDKAAWQGIVQVQGSDVCLGAITQTRSAQHDAKCGCAGRERRVKLAGVVRCGLLGHQNELFIALHRDLVNIAVTVAVRDGELFTVCKVIEQLGRSLYGNGGFAGHIKFVVAVFRPVSIYKHLEVSAILIAHRGKGNVAAVRHSGLAYKIAAGDLKIGT